MELKVSDSGLAPLNFGLGSSGFRGWREAVPSYGLPWVQSLPVGIIETLMQSDTLNPKARTTQEPQSHTTESPTPT